MYVYNNTIMVKSRSNYRVLKYNNTNTNFNVTLGSIVGIIVKAFKNK